MANTDTIIDHLAHQAEKGELALFVGANLSERLTGLPNNLMLAQAVSDRRQAPSGKTQSLEELAQAPGGRRQVLRVLTRHLETNAQSPQPWDITLARLSPVRFYLTTRYDRLLERAFHTIRRPVRVLYADLQISPVPSQEPRLLKLYGDLQEPDTVTLSMQEVRELDLYKPQLLSLARQVFASSTVLMLGFSPQDPTLSWLWKRNLDPSIGDRQQIIAVLGDQPLAQDIQLLARKDVTILASAPEEAVASLATRLLHETVDPYDLCQATLSGDWAGMLDDKDSQAVQATAPFINQRQPAPPDLSSDPMAPTDRVRQLVTWAGEKSKARRPASLLEYRNFDLELGRHNEGIAVRVLRSPQGEDAATVASFASPPPPLDQLASLDDLDKAVGRRLLPNAVGERWAANLATAEQAGQGLRLRLFIQDQALAGIPWEAANVRGRRLALRLATPIVRYIPAGRAPKPLKVEGPLRMLMVLSAAAEIGLKPLDVGTERSLLQEALTPLLRLGRVQIHWLEGIITRRELQDALRHLRPHVLHFAGHGAYAETERQGALFLGRRTGDGSAVPDVVGTAELGLLVDGSTVRFALLNACQTGQAAGGVAQALVREALPAALGMQSNVPDSAAAAFAGAFYRALADGWPVDAAVVEGRKLLALEVGINSPRWAMPVLYMRAPNGQLFEQP
jgi:hypothetical protein